LRDRVEISLRASNRAKHSAVNEEAKRGRLLDMEIYRFGMKKV